MILVIDNYDSFVYNLARYFEREGTQTKTVRNDEISMNEIIALNPMAIVISPGPCGPAEAGLSINIVKELGPTIPILGVCLGHQVIGEVYGGKTIRANKPVHGKASQITHNRKGLFHGLPAFMNVGRYHSLITDIKNTNDLVIDALNEDKIVMAMHHKYHPVYGLQFHPESILTDFGAPIIRNFIQIAMQWQENTQKAA